MYEILNLSSSVSRNLRNPKFLCDFRNINTFKWMLAFMLPHSSTWLTGGKKRKWPIGLCFLLGHCNVSGRYISAQWAHEKGRKGRWPLGLYFRCIYRTGNIIMSIRYSLRRIISREIICISMNIHNSFQICIHSQFGWDTWVTLIDIPCIRLFLGKCEDNYTGLSHTEALNILQHRLYKQKT